MAIQRFIGSVANRLRVKLNLSDLDDRQTALNTLSGATGATNEHVMTKDTSTGNVIFKASAGGGGGGTLPSVEIDCGTIVAGTTDIDCGSIA